MTVLDPVVVSRQLSARLAGDLEIGEGKIVAATAGERMIVRFATRGPHGPGPDLVAKMYADPQKAHRLFGLLHTLPDVPRPVAHLPGVCVYEASDGCSLDQLIGPARAAALDAAAGWLATLHASDVDFDRQLDLATELLNVSDWAILVASASPCDSGARELRDRLIAAADGVEAATTVPMHKDFHYQHTLFDAGRIVVIDLDEMRAGDPTVDVAHFAANLRLLGYRESDTGDEAAFVDCYRRMTGWPSDNRHDFWLAYTFLKLAKQLVRGRGPRPAPTGIERDREIEFVLGEGLQCLPR